MAFNATLIERVRAIPWRVCRTSQSRTLGARDGLRVGRGVRSATPLAGFETVQGTILTTVPVPGDTEKLVT